MVGRMRVGKANKGLGSFMSKVLNKMQKRMARLKVLRNREIARRQQPLAKKAGASLLYMMHRMPRGLSATAGKY
jgi:hypothetical protein